MWVYRRDSSFPYQTWKPFPDDAIVLVKGIDGDRNIGPAKDFWWGYEDGFSGPTEGVIIAAKRLERPLKRN